MDKDTIQVLLNDYVNAPDGSLLIKKGNRFVPISFEELNKKNEEELKELKSVPEKLDQFRETLTTLISMRKQISSTFSILSKLRFSEEN